MFVIVACDLSVEIALANPADTVEATAKCRAFSTFLFPQQEAPSWTLRPKILCLYMLVTMQRLGKSLPRISKHHVEEIRFSNSLKVASEKFDNSRFKTGKRGPHRSAKMETL